MQTPILNGVQKPADVIAKGSHVFNENTRKYEERPYLSSEYPRIMFHAEKDAVEARNREDQTRLESEGFRTAAFPAKPAKDTVTAGPVDLASIILRQQEEMRLLQERFDKLAAPVEKSRRGRESEEAKS